MYYGKVNNKVVEFAKRPKRWDRKLMGKEYSDFLLNCLSSEIGEDVRNIIVFKENSPIDLVWEALSLGLEAKRFRKTKFRNDGHAKAWLKTEYLSRFDDYERETGLNLRTRILCVTERLWTSEVDRWLRLQGHFLIETGSIDSIAEKQVAKELFIEQFSEILAQICSSRKVNVLEIQNEKLIEVCA